MSTAEDKMLLGALERSSKDQQALPSGTLFDVEPIDGWIHVEKVMIQDLKTQGGIIVPANINPKASVFRVAAVGDGELCAGTGGIYPPPVKVGDYILADITQMINVSYSGQETFVVGRSGIFGKLKFKEHTKVNGSA